MMGHADHEKQKKLLLIGSKEMGLVILRSVYSAVPDCICGMITINDKNDSRSVLPEIESFCRDNSISLSVLSQTRELANYISLYTPDMCLVVGWYSILSSDILEMVPQGFVGIHNSFLPKYRGQAPLVWQIINGERKVGYSIFQLSEGMDEGDIWHQDEIEIEESDYVENIISKIQFSATEFLKCNIRDMLCGTVRPVPQKDITPSYGCKRTPMDGLIDWSWDCRDVYNFIRAQSTPYPGAYSFFEEKRIIVWKAHPCNRTIFGLPGQGALLDEERKLVVACGGHSGLVLDEIEIDGTRYKAEEFFMKTNIRFKPSEASNAINAENSITLCYRGGVESKLFLRFFYSFPTVCYNRRRRTKCA